MGSIKAQKYSTVQKPSVELLLQAHQDPKINASAISGDKDSKAKLLAASKRLTAALEEPDDALNYAQFYPQVFMCVRVAVDLKLFHLIAEHGGPITAAELATASGAEQQLLVRLMRGLTWGNYVEEVDSETYQANSNTIYLLSPSVQAGVRHWYDAGLNSFYKMPEYFKSNKYTSPADAHTGPLQFAFNTNMESYAYWKLTPSFAENFNVFMSGKFTSETQSQPWLDYCPIQQNIVDGFDEKIGDAMFVDVGGSFGHVVQDFKRKFPAAPGRFIVEDLKDVIADIKTLDADIEAIPYDFFTPQPVIGARSYYFANVLHNWSDQDCQRILAVVSRAMVKDYSVLLLNEGIMPAKDCSLGMIGRDLGMMALHSAAERSESQWRDLLGKAGLKITDVWYSGIGEGVIAAGLI